MAIWEREDFLDASHFLISVPELFFLSFLHPSSSFSNLYWKGIYLIACNKKTRPTLKSFSLSKQLFWIFNFLTWKSKWHFSTVLNLNLKQWFAEERKEWIWEMWPFQKVIARNVPKGLKALMWQNNNSLPKILVFSVCLLRFLKVWEEE